MANAKHLEILKQGAEVWNKWRKDNPERRAALRGRETVFIRTNEVRVEAAGDQTGIELRFAFAECRKK